MWDSVNDEQTGWVASRFARLSTGLKMLLILSLGLFPLGLIAILASLQSARDNVVSRRGGDFPSVAATQRLVEVLLPARSTAVTW